MHLLACCLRALAAGIVLVAYVLFCFGPKAEQDTRELLDLLLHDEEGREP